MDRPRLIAIVLIGAFALAFVGGGLFVLRVQRTGERATATVTSCHHVYRSGTTCTGRWIAGGSLLDGGHVVFGTIDGAGPGDVGHTVAVSLDGNRAYTTSVRLPAVLIGVGVVVAALGGWSLRRKGSDAGSEQAPPADGGT